MIIDSWGKILKEIEQSETNTYSFYDIDLDEIKNNRKKMPCFDHKRNDVYKLKFDIDLDL